MFPARSPRRRAVLGLAAAAIVLAVLTAVGLYGLVAGTNATNSSQPEPSTPTEPAPDPFPSRSAVSSWQDLPPLPHTDNPVTYAKAAATSLFTWATMSGLSPEDYANPVLVDADPSGTETAGLIRDLDNYLPSHETWLQLQNYQTEQALTITGAYVPDAWVEIMRTDSSGRLAYGTVAVTIEGTRHRRGSWLGEQITSDHPVAFTVVLACQPTYDRCHTLRLSTPGTALR